MRTRLKVGLLAAAIACAAFVAAKAQEEKTYLPPEFSQDKTETTQPKADRHRVVRHRAAIVHRKRVRYARVYLKNRRHIAFYQYHHRKVRLVYYRPHYHHYRRYAYYRPVHYGYYRPVRYVYYRPVFPGFLFSMFHW